MKKYIEKLLKNKEIESKEKIENICMTTHFMGQ